MTTAFLSKSLKFWRVAAVTAAVLLVWSLASYFWPTVPTWNHGVLNVFREDMDFQVYFSNLGWIRHGELLLNHGYAEYPVLGLLYVNWPHYLVSSFEAYHWLLWFSNAALLAFSVWLWWRVAELMNLPRGGWWLWVLPSSLYFTLNRFDIFPVCLVLLSLYLMLTNRLRTAWVVYGLSIVAKVYPVFLLPLFLHFSREQKGSKLTVWPYVLAPIGGLLLGVYYVGGFEAVVVPFTLQLARGVGPGSLWALLQGFGFPSVYMSVLWRLVQVALPAWWLLRMFIGKVRLTTQTVLVLATLSLLLLTNFYPFYSNQWWLWVLPFAAWVLPTPQRIVAGLYDVFNYLQFPIMFELLGTQSETFALTVTMRCALALWLGVVLWRQLPKRWWLPL